MKIATKNEKWFRDTKVFSWIFSIQTDIEVLRTKIETVKYNF